MKAIRLFALVAIASALFTLDVPQAPAQSCRWDGTAPFCNGECSTNETEITRLGEVPPHWREPFINQEPQFGADCATGSKALCCPSLGVSCRWDGTAPFCDGECRNNETPSAPPAGSNSGASCWSGSKVYCCSKTGTIGQALNLAPIIVSGAGKCLDVHSPDQHQNGAKVQVWDCNGSKQQAWKLEGAVIKSGAGKCLDVHKPDQQLNGGKVQVWDCNGSKQQIWLRDGAVIKSGMGKCLDVYAPDQHQNGAKVQVWDCNGSKQQKWILP